MAPNLPFKVIQNIFLIAHGSQQRLLTLTQLNNPDLFKDKSLVNGEWVEAKSGKRFDVVGKLSPNGPTSAHQTYYDFVQQTQATAKYGQQPPTTRPKTPMQPSPPPTRPSRPSAKSAPGPAPSACSNGTL
jgi:hypothetical protein